MRAGKQPACGCCDKFNDHMIQPISLADCGPNTGITVWMFRNAELEPFMSNPGGDCGYFVGEQADDCDTKMHFLEWCEDGTWYLHAWFCEYDELGNLIDTSDLGVYESEANCSCTEGASPNFSVDTDGHCPCFCVQDIPSTLYLTLHDTATTIKNCDTWDGETATLTKIGDYSWQGYMPVLCEWDEYTQVIVTINSATCTVAITIGLQGANPSDNCLVTEYICALPCPFTSVELIGIGTGLWKFHQDGCECCRIGLGNISFTLSV